MIDHSTPVGNRTSFSILRTRNKVVLNVSCTSVTTRLAPSDAAILKLSPQPNHEQLFLQESFFPGRAVADKFNTQPGYVVQTDKSDEDVPIESGVVPNQ